jgi:hypothetical protein
LSDNSYIIGDPNLKPQIDDVFTLGYSFNKDYTFELYFRNENNPTLQYIYQDNEENLLIYKNTNTDVSISYGLDFTTYTQIIPHWNLYLLSSVYYYNNKFFPIDNNELVYSADRWSLYTEIINYFSFLKNKSLTMDVSFIYLSPTNYGPSDISSRSGIDINLRKMLWNNKGAINIGITDVFNTQNFTTTTQYLNQDVFSKFRKENRLFVLGFNYKFGNKNLEKSQKEIDLDERKRLK